jgi:hypothetical protein
MTCGNVGRIGMGHVYATKIGNKRVIGVIEEGELPVVVAGREIVYVPDENRFILQKIIYDEVNEKIQIIQIAVYDSDDECVKTSFNALFNESRYNDFRALWAYLYARVSQL